MSNYSEISGELKGISPLVAGIGNSNVFTVPEGYFATISDTVLVCIKEEISSINIDNPQVHTIPNDYFSSLADSIMAKIKAQGELSAAEELQAISPVLAGISKTNPFDLPGQYFDSLPSSILSQTGIEQTPAFLKDINQVQPFEVPQGYFENLPAAILSKVKRARVVSMPKRNILIRYAAAAVITGAVALGIFKYTNGPADTTSAQLEPSIEKGKNMDDKKFNETLNNLSEEDIAQYLVNNANDADIAVLTSSVEENDLPSQEDYLLDNTTLDNFLQEIDTKKLEN